MVKDWTSFFAIYCFIAAIPAAVLYLRGRGWRPWFLAGGVLLTWTGGGWLFLLWLALIDRKARFAVEDQSEAGKSRR